jgi:hypothetical protein
MAQLKKIWKELAKQNTYCENPHVGMINKKTGKYYYIAEGTKEVPRGDGSIKKGKFLWRQHHMPEFTYCCKQCAESQLACYENGVYD